MNRSSDLKLTRYDKKSEKTPENRHFQGYF